VSDVFERNRRAWDAASDAYQARHGPQLTGDPAAWGVWSLPETELVLLGDVAARDVPGSGLRPPEGAITTYDAFAPSAWAHDFPTELLIRARRR